MELEEELKKSREDNRKMETKCSRLQNFQNSVKHIFTNGQIKKLQNKNKRINWKIEDISSAICLHSAGPRAYRFLYKKKHPLPAPSTLRHWASKISVRPGILENVLHLMKTFEE